MKKNFYYKICNFYGESEGNFYMNLERKRQQAYWEMNKKAFKKSPTQWYEAYLKKKKSKNLP